MDMLTLAHWHSHKYGRLEVGVRGHRGPVGLDDSHWGTRVTSFTSLPSRFRSVQRTDSGWSTRRRCSVLTTSNSCSSAQYVTLVSSWLSSSELFPSSVGGSSRGHLPGEPARSASRPCPLGYTSPLPDPERILLRSLDCPAGGAPTPELRSPIHKFHSLPLTLRIKLRKRGQFRSCRASPLSHIF